MIEDGAAVNIEMRGSEVTVYPHNGYDDQGDDFWYEDQGHDKGSPTTVTAIIQNLPTDEELMAAGFDENAELSMTCVEGTFEEGYLVEVGSHEFIITSKVTKFSQNIEFMTMYGLKSVNES